MYPKLQKALEVLNAVSKESNGEPDVGQFWLTRNKKYKIFILLNDSARTNFPITGVLLDESQRKDFKLEYKMECPRFHYNGRFNSNIELWSELDLIYKLPD